MTEQNLPLPIRERRRAERFPIALDVFSRYTPKGTAKEGELKAVSKDISGTGISVISRQPLATGISMGIIVSTKKYMKRGDKIEFSIGDQKKGTEFFSVRCKVLWSRMVGKDKYQAGLSYLQIEKQDQFIEFICGKMMEQHNQER